MKHLYLFEEFVNTQATRNDIILEHRSLYKNIFMQFDDLSDHMNEAMALVDAGIFDDMLVENIVDMEEDEIYENLFKKAKEKFDAAVQTAKQKGKEALTDTQKVLVKLGGDITNIIKLVVQKIAEACKAAFEWGAQQAKAAMSKGKEDCKKAIKGVKDPKNLVQEVKNAKAMLSSVKAWVLGGFSKESAKAMAAAAKQDEGFSQYTLELALYKAINEAVVSGQLNFSEMINEGGGFKIPFVSTIAAKLNKIPPFKQLYQVKNAVKDVVGGALDKFSVWATEVTGAPGPYKFVALATLVGILVEMEVKNTFKHAAMDVVLQMGLPGVGTVIKYTATVAKYLAYVAIIETLLAEVHGQQDEKEPQTT